MDIQQHDDDLFISMLLLNDQTLTNSDENFALELQLQEAMVSSFTAASKKELITCEICAEMKGKPEMFPFEDQCRHACCKDCISKHVRVQLEKRRTLITCPCLDCTTVLDIATCREILPPDVRRTWEELLVRVSGGDGGVEREEDSVFVDVAKVNKWQRCPNCKFYVEKIDGCLHITCRCQFQFCYACGEHWSSTHGGCQ